MNFIKAVIGLIFFAFVVAMVWSHFELRATVKAMKRHIHTNAKLIEGTVYLMGEYHGHFFGD